MKKVFISMMLSVFTLSMNAQEYWINDNFSTAATESGYWDTPYTLQGSGNIELTRHQCNFETNGGTIGLRVGDTDKGGYAEFSIPAGSGVGTITLNFKAKGSTANRIAIVSINEADEPNITEVGSAAPKEFEKTLNTTGAVTVRMRSGNTDPIIINSIQVSKYSTPTGTADTKTENLTVYSDKDVLYVKNIAGSEKVDIYNAQGVLLISTKTSGKTEVSIPVSGLAQGIYVVKAGTKTVKIQK